MKADEDKFGKSNPSRPTYAEISLEAIQHNLTLYRELTSTPIMAVVKANAYGHGAVPVAQAAAEAGIDWFGVAFTGEGLALRKAGIGGGILVMGYTPTHLAGEAIEGGLSLAVYEEGLAREYAHAAATRGLIARLHVKVDSGMGRLGLDPDAAYRLVCQIGEIKGAVVEGVFTHFATADEADPSFACLQLSRFNGLVKGLEGSGHRPPLVHAANSAAALGLPEARFDLVRMGIAIYGLHPSSEAPLPKSARPALGWKTTISQVRWMEPGTPVSYGRTYTTKGKEQIAALPVGYADGFRRYSLQPTFVLVHGIRVPVVGRVCMDQMMIDVSAVEGVQTGDEVVLIGQQGEEHISAEEVAGWWGTINYEVTCGIMARVPRVYG